MEFRCRLGTAGGEIIEGVYVADSEAHLRRELEEKGLFILSLQRRGLLPAFGLSRGHRRRIGRQELLVFNQELATLLDILRQRVANPTFKAVLDGVYEKVRSGPALSDAFAEHPDLFPAVYSASLMAGERAGNLDEVIRRYVAYEKVIGAVRRRTISALIYPMILVTLMLVLVGIIVLRVVPAFSEFYSNFGKQLPLSTRIILGISNIVVGNFALIVVGILAAAIGMNAERPQRGLRHFEPGLLEQLAHRRRGKALARLGHALRDVPARRTGRMPEQQALPVGDNDPAAGRFGARHAATSRYRPGTRRRTRRPPHCRTRRGRGDSRPDSSTPSCTPGTCTANPGSR